MARKDVRHQFEGFEDDVRRAITVRVLQRVADIAIGGERQALLCDHRPTDVATQPFELLALICSRRDPSV